MVDSSDFHQTLHASMLANSNFANHGQFPSSMPLSTVHAYAHSFSLRSRRRKAAHASDGIDEGRQAECRFRVRKVWCWKPQMWGVSCSRSRLHHGHDEAVNVVGYQSLRIDNGRGGEMLRSIRETKPSGHHWNQSAHDMGGNACSLCRKLTIESHWNLRLYLTSAIKWRHGIIQERYRCPKSVPADDWSQIWISGLKRFMFDTLKRFLGFGRGMRRLMNG